MIFFFFIRTEKTKHLIPNSLGNIYNINDLSLFKHDKINNM